MATKKYLSLERLQEYDALIKEVIAAGDEDAVDRAGTNVNEKISAHNTDSDAHSDIRTAVDGKVDTSDIADDLETGESQKVLSAAQGVAIKVLIDALQEAVDKKSDKDHTHAIEDVTNTDDLELITVDDIDTICGATIQMASEVEF